MTVAVVDSGGADASTTFTHGDRYTAIVGRAMVRDAQFHPECSGLVGQQLLRSFFKENIS